MLTKEAMVVMRRRGVVLRARPPLGHVAPSLLRYSPHRLVSAPRRSHPYDVLRPARVSQELALCCILTRTAVAPAPGTVNVNTDSKLTGPLLHGLCRVSRVMYLGPTFADVGQGKQRGDPMSYGYYIIIRRITRFGCRQTINNR